MMRDLREFDWQRFWLQEVVVLGAPTLITVMTSPENPPLSRPRLVILLVVLLGMSAFNVILSKLGNGRR